MRRGSETLIFWGAGATATLGFSTTQQQAKKIHALIGEEAGARHTVERCQAFFDKPDWAEALAELLLILGDGDTDLHHVSEQAKAAMRRNWADSADEPLVERIHQLRVLFDWQALKEAAQICPGFSNKDNFKLQDLFNVIDLHAQSFHGFKAERDFLPPHRLLAARRALQLILNTLQFMEWHLARVEKAEELGKHLAFAQCLTAHHQQQGLQRAANGTPFDTRDFYLGDVAFVSLNYDPVALWAQFIANREANNAHPPNIGFPGAPLKIFHDFGIFMAVSTIEQQGADANAKERVWYPLNEASAQRLNDRDHISRRVRINKYLLPHGCLCWRECPNCGKLTAFMGKEWRIDSPALIPPPPLRHFAELAKIETVLAPARGKEAETWARGEVDARECVHCGEMTHAQHAQTILQSNFKQSLPSFIDEVQRDMRVVTQFANHIILLGYSLPPDDVSYRAFFAARKQRNRVNPVRCSVVVGTDYGDTWHAPDEIDRLKPAESPSTTLEAARDIFGKENVRFYGGGFPQVICENGVVSAGRVERLISWSDVEARPNVTVRRCSD